MAADDVGAKGGATVTVTDNKQVSNMALVDKLRSDASGEPIPVPISYEIIRLFSESLYQSPHKAIEELVSNGFDAGARSIFVITPRSARIRRPSRIPCGLSTTVPVWTTPASMISGELLTPRRRAKLTLRRKAWLALRTSA